MKTFGIDLGTTYSLIGHMKQFGKPKTIKDQGEALLASVVCFTEKSLLTGMDAKIQQQINDENAMTFFKRSIDAKLLEYINQEKEERYPPPKEENTTTKEKRNLLKRKTP